MDLEKRNQEDVQEKGYIAVRPRHRMERIGDVDAAFKTRNILNVAFMLLAVCGVCLYLFTANKNVAYIVMIVGVVVKIVEVSLRMFHK